MFRLVLSFPKSYLKGKFSMSTFLFTATDSDGKTVTERVEAENLSSAKYKLEIQGYEEITFYESELSNDVLNTFDDKTKEAREKMLERQVAVQYDNSFGQYILFNLKATAIVWIPLLIWGIFSTTWFSFFALGIFALTFIYISLPIFLFDKLHQSHNWAQNRQVRFWGQLTNLFNKITFLRIPQSQIDYHLACADAREGNLNAALSKIMKYENDAKVSRRLFYNHLGSIYGNAKKFDELLDCQEKSLREGNDYPEEMIDYAMSLARRHRKTNQAREVLQKVLDRETTALAKIFIPFCQGVIEVEDGNLSRAEFYLTQASKQIEPFRKNSYLVGLRSEIKAFLLIALGKQGEREKAIKLLREAKPYLVAHKETELLRKCEDAVC